MVLTPGDCLGPYEVVAVIGAGGMGEVYRARDTRLRRDVAIKTLPGAFASDPERLRRFRHEALAAASISHPNILAVYDIGIHQGSPYVVTELLEGVTLGERLTDGAVPVAAAVAYGSQIAEGLAAAHRKGIVHRDLKPENVFLTVDARIKILDFGLAKTVDPVGGADADATTMTSTGLGVILGTVGYMSPEQARGLAADRRSDIFSFGAVLYELLSGRRAFQGQTQLDTLNAILRDAPLKLASPFEKVPSRLRAIVDRCLEKLPERRYESAADLATALGRVPVRTGRSGILLAILVVLLLAALSGYVALGRRTGTAPSPRIRIAMAQPGTVSFMIGSGIVDVLNQTSGMPASVAASAGAVEAVRRLDAGEAEFALANSQLAFHAVKTDRLLGHRSQHIAGVAVLFRVPLHVIVRKDADISTIQDLRGKRLSVGLEASGERFLAERLLENFELPASAITTKYLEIEPSLAELQAGRLDAYIASRGLPHPAIAAAMATGRIRLVSMDPERIAGLRMSEPFVLPFTIPKGTYPQQNASVTTVAIPIVLLASTATPDRVVEGVLDAIARHVSDLVARHPTAAEIDLRQAPSLREGMPLELHPGALNFYKRR